MKTTGNISDLKKLLDTSRTITNDPAVLKNWIELNNFYWHCYYCGQKLRSRSKGDTIPPAHLHPNGQSDQACIEHTMGFKSGSPIVVSCRSCNSVKNTRNIEEFRDYIFGVAQSNVIIKRTYTSPKGFYKSSVKGKAFKALEQSPILQWARNLLPVRKFFGELVYPPLPMLQPVHSGLCDPR